MTIVFAEVVDADLQIYTYIMSIIVLCPKNTEKYFIAAIRICRCGWVSLKAGAVFDLIQSYQ